MYVFIRVYVCCTLACLKHCLSLMTMQVHILVISTENGRTIFTWSSPQLLFASPWVTVPGRCHCAVSIGSAVMCFGGGASNSNGFFLIDCKDLYTASESTASATQGDVVENKICDVTSIVMVTAPKLYGLCSMPTVGCSGFSDAPSGATARHVQHVKPALPYSRLSATAVRIGTLLIIHFST